MTPPKKDDSGNGNSTKLAVLVEKVTNLEKSIDHIDSQVSNSYATKVQVATLEAKILSQATQIKWLTGFITSVIVLVLGAIISGKL